MSFYLKRASIGYGQPNIFASQFHFLSLSITCNARHADGSLKFWDASAVLLQILYKLKTAKIFEKPKAKSLDGQDDDPFAIQQIALCAESRLLCVANASSHVLLFRFSKSESMTEVPVIMINDRIKSNLEKR